MVTPLRVIVTCRELIPDPSPTDQVNCCASPSDSLPLDPPSEIEGPAVSSSVSKNHGPMTDRVDISPGPPASASVAVASMRYVPVGKLLRSKVDELCVVLANTSTPLEL